MLVKIKKLTPFLRKLAFKDANVMFSTIFLFMKTAFGDIMSSSSHKKDVYACYFANYFVILNLTYDSIASRDVKRQSM